MLPVDPVYSAAHLAELKRQLQAVKAGKKIPGMSAGAAPSVIRGLVREIASVEKAMRK